MEYNNSENDMFRDCKKIGYIKINSCKGQITFVAFDKSGAVIYNRPNIHKDNIKKNNVIHLNVYTELFIEHAKQIKQHIEMLIRMYLDLDVKDFKMLMHELNPDMK